jgi:hypothetical protein
MIEIDAKLYSAMRHIFPNLTLTPEIMKIIKHPDFYEPILYCFTNASKYRVSVLPYGTAKETDAFDKIHDYISFGALENALQGIRDQLGKAIQRMLLLKGKPWSKDPKEIMSSSMEGRIIKFLESISIEP